MTALRDRGGGEDEAILGVYCTYKGQLGMYTISLVLGGAYAENNLLMSTDMQDMRTATIGSTL